MSLSSIISHIAPLEFIVGENLVNDKSNLSRTSQWEICLFICESTAGELNVYCGTVLNTTNKIW
jgi:hypothetical protein